MITTLDPSYQMEDETTSLAPRLRSLAGATVGLLDNNKKNVGTFYFYLEQILRDEYHVADVKRLRKENRSAPAEPEVLAELAKCDAVVSAIGDCGSCSSCSLYDAIAVERLGVPAAAVMTSAFVETARTMGEMCGFPDYPFVVIEHPVSSNAKDVIAAKARLAAEEVVGLLVES